jgi:hypothetical protein
MKLTVLGPRPLLALLVPSLPAGARPRLRHAEALTADPRAARTYDLPAARRRRRLGARRRLSIPVCRARATLLRAPSARRVGLIRRRWAYIDPVGQMRQMAERLRGARRPGGHGKTTVIKGPVCPVDTDVGAWLVRC